ncbi:MAG: YtxH domain-containing protein [Bacteroidia bacterium]|jgi:gas vesicle protein
MMEQNKSKLLWGLAIGAAAGFVLGYLLSGKKLSDLEQDLTDASGKVKDKINDTFEKGKDIVHNMKESMNERDPQQS